MNCPACGAAYQPGDRFCGTCGERLGDGATPSGNGISATAPTDAPVMAQAAPSLAAPPPPVAMPAHNAALPTAPAAGSAPCPVCRAALAMDAVRCPVCNFEPGASVIAPGGLAAAAPRLGGVQADTAAPMRVCPTHGPLDPSWTRCPYCLKEGREGRLPSGPVGLSASAAAPLSPAPAITGQPVPPRMEPDEAIVPSTPAPVGSASRPPLPDPALPAAPLPRDDQPRSSVGATFAIRRRPRVLAYLIEKAGEAVGRVHQLDDDVTDLGRDPRNHIVLTDVVISGFHARVERGPDGGFIVQDRNSTNGSFLNDAPLSTTRRMEENDELRMGNTVLVLKVVQ